MDLQTEHVTIEMVDGDWAIAPGELFKPQDVSALSPHGPMKARDIQSNLSMYTVKGHKDNVRDVIVRIDGNEELNGKIIFFNVYADGTSASAKRKLDGRGARQISQYRATSECCSGLPAL